MSMLQLRKKIKNLLDLHISDFQQFKGRVPSPHYLKIENEEKKVLKIENGGEDGVSV